LNERTFYDLVADEVHRHHTLTSQGRCACCEARARS
jgi:hypothetical protein